MIMIFNGYINKSVYYNTSRYIKNNKYYINRSDRNEDDSYFELYKEYRILNEEHNTFNARGYRIIDNKGYEVWISEKDLMTKEEFKKFKHNNKFNNILDKELV